jgi:hypothetical protein
MGSNLTYGKRDNIPTQSRCPGCNQLTDKAFGVYGKLFTTVGFRDIVTERLEFNPVTRKSELVTETKRVPINQYVRGLICSQCQTYKTITHKSGRWSYIFIPESQEKQRTSINPGYSRYHEYERSEPERKLIKHRSEAESGVLVFDLITKCTEQEK